MRAYLLAIAAGLVVLVGRGYHFFIHPEWSEALAFWKLWWVWLIAILLTFAAILSLPRRGA